MQSRRWTAVALAAVLAAGIPGALRLLPSERSLDRAAPVVDDHVDRMPTAVAGRVIGSPVVGVPPVEDAPVAIAPPPPGALTGAPAPAIRSAAVPYAGATYQDGSTYALVVGINDYPGVDHDLNYAASDAGAIDTALARFGVPAPNRLVLRDGQARRPELIRAIQALVDRAPRGSTIVFAFAGHIRKIDGNTEEIVTADGETLPDWELARLLAPARSERMWVLLASCYAGGFTEVLAPGRILTAAADSNSLAYESQRVKGSFLVHHMIREGWLNGQAGSSVQEAFAYAEARMDAAPREGRPVQYDVSGERLRLGGASGGSGSSDPSTPTSSPTTAPPPAKPEEDDPERNCTLLVLCSRS